MRGSIYRAISLLVSPALAIAFTPPAAASSLGGFFHATQQAPYSFGDTILRLRFDLAAGIVYGHETAIVYLKHALHDLPFNTSAIHYEKITVNSVRAAYSVNDAQESMTVHLASPAGSGTRLRIDFYYWTKPTRGLYFVRPDQAYPRISPEIWTQGEPTDNRAWFPTWDQPNEKTPSELIITVPSGWTVVGNGSLKARVRRGSDEVWDWVSVHPKSTYLIAFAAGRFAEWHDALGRLPVDSFVEPDMARYNALCFRRTKDMIAFYQRITHTPFPFAKYDQIAVERFIFGGMEDASDTIVTDLVLHPPIEDVENSCEQTVSHELAQHWYGDDETTEDWANIWLNEGFATYYDELWTAERFGEPDFEYARYTAQQAYFHETQQYMRPIVDYVYADPDQVLIDTSSHQRPAQVLHMLRSMVGDARFFPAVDEFLHEYAYRNADTRQFFNSIDKTLGMDLTWFQNEWFYRASYPHYVVSDKYQSRTHSLLVHVEQHNPDGRPFRMPIVIQAFSGEHMASIDTVVSQKAQDLTIPNVETKPDMVLFNPNGTVLSKLTFPKSAAELAYQLEHAKHVADREWALTELSRDANAPAAVRSIALAAVARATTSDPFWGLRQDAVPVAASFNDSATTQRALRDRDVRVRIAAEGAAAQLRNAAPAVIKQLETYSTDANPDVASAALTALGALRPPGTFQRLAAALNRASFDDAVAIGALGGLSAHCDRAAYGLIRPRISYGIDELEREAAVQALAACAFQLKDPELGLEPLVALAFHDPLIAMRMAAASALGTLHDKRAVPYLERLERTDPQEVVRLDAQAALDSLK